MANGLLDPTWAPDLADLVKRQQLREAAEKRKALSGGTTRLRQPTATPVEDAFPINPAYTTAASEYLTPSLPGAPNTGVVVSPLAQDPRFVERYPERAKRLLLGDEIRSMTANAVAEKRSETPGDSFKIGFNAGQELAEPQNQRNFLSSLLGSVDWQGLLKVFARPEFLQSGISPAQAFVNASFAQRQAEAGAAAELQKQQLELQKEAIKATPQFPKPSSEITQLYTKIASGQETLKALSKMQGIMSEGTTTGGAALGIGFITNLAAAFNINIGETDKTNLNRQVAKVRSALIASRAFGREANKAEQKLIEELLPEGGTFTNIDELANAYRAFKDYVENDMRVTSGILKNVYGLPSYSQAVPETPRAFTRGQ